MNELWRTIQLIWIFGTLGLVLSGLVGSTGIFLSKVWKYVNTNPYIEINGNVTIDGGETVISGVDVKLNAKKKGDKINRQSNPSGKWGVR